MFRVVLAVALLFGVLSLYGFAEARTLTEADYQLSSPAVPAKFDGLRIVFLSDIHRGRYLSQERVRDVVDRANSLSPDLVILGGDYVYGDRRYVEPCFEELRRLRAPLGVFGVLGNHDHWNGAELTRRQMAAAGVVDLDDRGVWLERGGERIRLGGVDDLLEGEPDMNPTIAPTEPDDFVLLVSHNPDFVVRVPPDLPEGTVDLMLSGHTHGGQVTFFGLWVRSCRRSSDRPIAAGSPLKAPSR